MPQLASVFQLMMEHLDLSELVYINIYEQSKSMRSLALASFFFKLNELLKQPYLMEQIKEVLDIVWNKYVIEYDKHYFLLV